MNKNITGMLKFSNQKTATTKKRVEKIIDNFLKEGKKINFNSIAKESGVSKSFLYNNEEIKIKIDKLRKESGVQLKEKKLTLNNNDFKKIKMELEILKKENKELKKEIEILRGELYKLI